MNKVGAHTTVHMDMQRSQPPPTSAVMTTSTTETSINPSTPTSVFQHVIVQQTPKTQPAREENAKNNGILCKFLMSLIFSLYILFMYMQSFINYLKRNIFCGSQKVVLFLFLFYFILQLFFQ